MPRFNIGDYPRGYGVRDREPELSMARGALRALQNYANRANDNNANKKKTNGRKGH